MDASDRNRTTVAGFLILRLFLAQFWLLQMIGKARDQESGITSIGNLGTWARITGDWMVKSTPLPEWLVRPFLTALPFLEAVLGVLVLIGLLTRPALVVSGLLLVALDVGLMLQLKHDVVGTNTIVLLATLLALTWEPANRWCLDRLIADRRRA